VRTAVYLFADRSKAEDALRAMLDMGFARDHVDLLTGDDADAARRDALVIDGGNADAYRQAAREGGTLLTVTGEETELGDADFILMDYAHVNINAWTPPRLDAAIADPALSASDGDNLVPTPAPVTEIVSNTAPPPALPTAKSPAPTKGRIHVDTHITEQAVEQPVHLQSETVVVERRAVERPVAWGEHLFVARHLDFIEFEEEAVVSKTAQVVEEIVIARNFAEKIETVRETLRRSDVVLDETEPPVPAGPTAEEMAAERAEAERAARERAEAERLDAERIAAEKAAADRAEAERRAAEKAETERLAAEKAEQEKAEEQRLAAERAEAEQAAKAEAERREAERLAAVTTEKAEAEKANIAQAEVQPAAEAPEAAKTTSDETGVWGDAPAPTTAAAEPAGGESPWGEAPVIRRRTHRIHSFTEIERDLRAYHARSHADSGYTYEQFAPVYQYGFSLAVNEQFRGRDWAHVEADARAFWEQSNPGTWDMFKDGIYYAWAKASG
jgi:hypothetical protein